jgi:hypothetical protein
LVATAYPGVETYPSAYLRINSQDGVGLRVDVENKTSMHTAKHGEWCEDEGDQQGFSSREEDTKLIRFESSRWRPKTTQVRVHLGVQE